MNILTSEYYISTSIRLFLRILTVKQVTSLPAAFNLNSPQDCGSCRQLLLSASSMVYCYTHGKMLLTADPEADGGSAEEWKKKADQTEPFQDCVFQVMPVDQKLKRHKKGALRGKKKKREEKRLPTEPALSLLWCWGPAVHTATRQRGGARVGSVTIEWARMKMTEGKRRKDPPQNNKMAGSSAGVREPLLCLTPSASEQACMIRGEKERRRMREEGGAKTGIGILGAGEFWQCLKAHWSWLIMLSWEGGGGGLKMNGR